jgi:anaerobic ribonucleoside-triphosphate reductase activating protein
VRVRWNQIRAKSLVDGPGERAVLWVQGCPIHCPGCQSVDLWPMDGGGSGEIETLVKFLLACNSDAVTITGGEPMAQPVALANIVTWLRVYASKVDIIVYTGFTYEALLDKANQEPVNWPYYHEILMMIDTLVDGPYIAALDHDKMQWRGSSNQRPIDMPATLKAGKVVVRDWDSPRIIIGKDGTIVAAAGFDLGLEGADTRLCGQV